MDASALLLDVHDEDSPSRRGRFGGKGIGFVASVALTVNNISGAGMLEFPQMFQRAGLLPSLLSLGLVCVVSSLFATTLADTVARVPHNKDFSRRIEFSDVFEEYIGRRTAILTQAVFFLNLLSQNLAAIVACAQMFDSFAGNFYPGGSYAFRLSPAPVGWVYWDPSHCGGDATSASDGPQIGMADGMPDGGEGGMSTCVPFAAEGDAALLISSGYVATLLLLAPLGLMTLEENMLQQKLSFGALFLLSGQFVWTFACTGLSDGHLPWIGHHWADSLGVVIFNFAFCVTVPSWLNEKAPHVSVNTVFWTSTTTATVLYTAVGVLGALAFPQVPENMLSLMLSSQVGCICICTCICICICTWTCICICICIWTWAWTWTWTWTWPCICISGMLSLMLSSQVGLTTRLCATLFGVVIIGFGVPIFCVIMRYNLVSGGLCSEGWAHVWSSVLPWACAWMLYQGNLVLHLLSWSGLVLNGFIDFLMPGAVTLASLGAAALVRRQVSTHSPLK